MNLRQFSLPVSVPAAALIAACSVPAAASPDLAVVRGTLRSPAGMVVSAYPHASRAGAEVLRAGGNAVDAAIATGFALAVTHPVAGNIGGGGFMVIRFPDGRSTVMDFREKAPLGAHPRMFLDEDGEYSSRIHHRSHLAVGVPGTVAGFALAHERYGSAEWTGLVAPSVALARDGFEISERLANSLARRLDAFRDYPATFAQFFRDGQPYSAGDTLVQSDLAATLTRIRDRGRDGFYAGETARLLAGEMERGGGWITEEDLARYRAVEREPVRGTYRGYDIISMAPPSSGGTALVQMLNVLEGFDVAAMGAIERRFARGRIIGDRIAQRNPLHIVGPLDIKEIQQGRWHIDILHQAASPFARHLRPRVPHEERDIGQLVVPGHAHLAPPIVLAKMKTMIGGDNQQGVVPEIQFVHHIQHRTQVMIAHAHQGGVFVAHVLYLHRRFGDARVGRPIEQRTIVLVRVEFFPAWLGEEWLMRVEGLQLQIPVVGFRVGADEFQTLGECLRLRHQAFFA